MNHILAALVAFAAVPALAQTPPTDVPQATVGTTPSPAPREEVSDASRTRYFYGPSALMLHRGEIIFSQRELLFSEGSVGITDHVSLMVGSAIPLLGNANNFMGGVKAGGSVNQWFHVAAGAETYVLPQFGGVGFLFGAATLGNESRQFTVAGGAPFAFAGNGQSLGDFLFTVSGSIRLGQHISLMTENWFLPTVSLSNGSLPMVNAGGVRFIANDLSADVGFLHAPGLSFPIPWVNFTYRWANVWS